MTTIGKRPWRSLLRAALVTMTFGLAGLSLIRTSEAGDADCAYQVSIAALFEYCDAKGEFEIWVSPNPDMCPDIVHVTHPLGTGWYSSYEEWQTQHPCHEGPPGPDPTD